MIARACIGKAAQITFTSDFHELLDGDLRRGEPVTLRYDPLRIIPADHPYVFGSPACPIYAYAQFCDAGPVVREILRSPAGIVAQPDYDICGQGSMLLATIAVPDDAEQVILWFCFLPASGELLFDSDYGNNYCFRFASAEVQVVAATVSNDAAKQSSEFALRVAAINAVEAVSVRFRIAGKADFGNREVSLARSDHQDAPHRTLWSADGVAVPYLSCVQFKLFYWLHGRRYKDDNSSQYYLAPTPPAENLPPPPGELVEMARAWQL